jgi:catechol 2,3-dioxygenase-like lactoylglutathione lyase family enzyme
MILGLDHLQISIPQGRLREALDFYISQLGFTRIPKPAEMEAKSGGAWLLQGGFKLHLGEEAHFKTDGRGHPCFLVHDVNAAVASAHAAGFQTRHDAGPAGYRRASVWDPFGNRIEFIQALSDGPNSPQPTIESRSAA